MHICSYSSSDSAYSSIEILFGSYLHVKRHFQHFGIITTDIVLNTVPIMAGYLPVFEFSTNIGARI